MRNVDVRINDRGPFVRGRVIDLSPAAFSRLAPLSRGVVRVRLEVIRMGKERAKFSRPGRKRP
jgi:rare lipoprotein A